VLEASVALSWCFNNEATAVGDRVLERLAAETVSVPAIWHLEIANVLALSERRGRITPANSSEFIALHETLDVVIDEETPSRALGRVLDLARAERLTAYDAAYLELVIWSWRCGWAFRSHPRAAICAMLPSASASACPGRLGTNDLQQYRVEPDRENASTYFPARRPTTGAKASR